MGQRAVPVERESAATELSIRRALQKPVVVDAEIGRPIEEQLARESSPTTVMDVDGRAEVCGQSRAIYIERHARNDGLNAEDPCYGDQCCRVGQAVRQHVWSTARWGFARARASARVVPGSLVVCV